MTDTQPTPWHVRPGHSVLDIVASNGHRIAIVGNAPYWNTFSSEDEGRARLIVRLANLYFAGTARDEKHAAEVLARGDVPANLDYGLTENEIAAASMMNALMDENAELLEALENLTAFIEGEAPSLAEENCNVLTALAVIRKSKGDS